MPKTALVVDSACALPAQYMHDNHIFRVPVTLSIDSQVYLDPMDDRATLRLLNSEELRKRKEVSTQGPAMGSFDRCFEQLVRNGYQRMIVQTVSGSFSNTWREAERAVKARSADASPPEFVLTDTQSLFSGQALLAAETVTRLQQTRGDSQSLRRHIESVRSSLVTRFLPGSPATSLARVRLRGGKALTWADALMTNALGLYPILEVAGDDIGSVGHVRGYEQAVAQLFDGVIQWLEAGRAAGSMAVVQYAGPLSELTSTPAYQRLVQAARDAGVSVVPAVASLPAGIYSGLGTVLVSLPVRAG